MTVYHFARDRNAKWPRLQKVMMNIVVSWSNNLPALASVLVRRVSIGCCVLRCRWHCALGWRCSSGRHSLHWPTCSGHFRGHYGTTDDWTRCCYSISGYCCGGCWSYPSPLCHYDYCCHCCSYGGWEWRSGRCPRMSYP